MYSILLKNTPHLMQTYINQSELNNCEIISDEKIKSHILYKSIFAVTKSGTVSLEICNAKIPSIVLYKMGFINFLIIKSLVKVKYANIINFAADEEIIPELLQSKCSAENIFKNVSFFLDNPNKMSEQVKKVNVVLNKLKINGSSSELASLSLNKFFVMLVYTHNDCLLKNNGFNHPERKERLDSILASIKKVKDFKIDIKEAPLANLDTITLIHPKHHIQKCFQSYQKPA